VTEVKDGGVIWLQCWNLKFTSPQGPWSEVVNGRSLMVKVSTVVVSRTTPMASYCALSGISTTAVSVVSGPTRTFRTSSSTPLPSVALRPRRHQYFQGFSSGSSGIVA